MTAAQLALAVILAILPHIIALAIVLLTARAALRLKAEHDGPVSWKAAVMAISRPSDDSLTSNDRRMASFGRRMRVVCLLVTFQICLGLLFLAL